ncbi:hypothetical protein LMG22931_01261 [Paraburkholderia nemoris]|nr:hypothetical protein LMG22931_01261 [Paraburkholderia nemoris]
MSVYVVDDATFRPGEDIAISVCVGRWGSALRWTQELYTGCIQHSGIPDIWTDAYHALYRHESAQLVSEEATAVREVSTSKSIRVAHLSCFVERARGPVQDAAARFSVTIDSAGRVRGEAVATGQPAVKIARVRVDPAHSASDICLGVLLHLASMDHQPAVASLMDRMRRGETK